MEVELGQGFDLLEPGLGKPPCQSLLAPAVDLVLEERLQELQIADLVPLGLLQAELQGVKHPAQAQGLQVCLQLVGHHGRSLLWGVGEQGEGLSPPEVGR